MVFYFSGTGNSYHVAKKLAEGLGEKMIDMARATREDAYEYTLKKGEKLGFVFPVHAWAPPQMVEQFVQRLELYYEEDVYTYAVCTLSCPITTPYCSRRLHRKPKDICSVRQTKSYSSSCGQ